MSEGPAHVFLDLSIERSFVVTDTLYKHIIVFTIDLSIVQKNRGVLRRHHLRI